MLLFSGRVKRSTVGKLLTIYKTSSVTYKVTEIPLYELQHDENWETVFLDIFSTYEEAINAPGNGEIVEEH